MANWYAVTNLPPNHCRTRKVFRHVDTDLAALRSLRELYPQAKILAASSRSEARDLVEDSSRTGKEGQDVTADFTPVDGPAAAAEYDQVKATVDAQHEGAAMPPGEWLRKPLAQDMSPPPVYMQTGRTSLDPNVRSNAPSEEDATPPWSSPRLPGVTQWTERMEEEGRKEQDRHARMVTYDQWMRDTYGLTTKNLADLDYLLDNPQERNGGKIGAIVHLRNAAIRGPAGHGSARMESLSFNGQGEPVVTPARDFYLGLYEGKNAVEHRMAAREQAAKGMQPTPPALAAARTTEVQSS